MRTSRERFLECVRDPRCLQGSADLLVAGRARLEAPDLGALQLDRRELDQLRACRPRDCDIHLTGEAIARLGGIDWSRPAASEEAAERFRAALIGDARAYAREGNPALPCYEDGQAPVPVAKSLGELLKRPLLGLDEAPELRRYLSAFPSGRPARLEEFFAWHKEKTWRKRVIALHHVLVLDQSGSQGTRVLVVSKLLYASQCYESAIEVVLLTRPPGEDRASLVFMSRARADIRPSGFTWMERVLLRRLVDRRLENRLRMLKERLETSPPPEVVEAAGKQRGAGPASLLGTSPR